MKFRCLKLCGLPDRSRPRSVGDVAHQEEVVQTLEKALEGSANVRTQQQTSDSNAVLLLRKEISAVNKVAYPVVVKIVKHLAAASVMSPVAD